jgi:hypothetical protein
LIELPIRIAQLGGRDEVADVVCHEPAVQTSPARIGSPRDFEDATVFVVRIRKERCEKLLRACFARDRQAPRQAMQGCGDVDEQYEMGDVRRIGVQRLVRQPVEPQKHEGEQADARKDHP